MECGPSCTWKGIGHLIADTKFSEPFVFPRCTCPKSVPSHAIVECGPVCFWKGISHLFGDAKEEKDHTRTQQQELKSREYQAIRAAEKMEEKYPTYFNCDDSVCVTAEDTEEDVRSAVAAKVFEICKRENITDDHHIQHLLSTKLSKSLQTLNHVHSYHCFE